MLKKIVVFGFLLCFTPLFGQQILTDYKTLKIKPTLDTIFIEKVSINPQFFELLDNKNNSINTAFYSINFQKSFLLLNKKIQLNKDSLTIKYLRLPVFLTQEYQNYDLTKVISSQSNQNNLAPFLNLDTPEKKPIFDGLLTTGSITRGLTVGNNQNAVVNSNLDLQIEGKIAPNINLRAAIQDSNLPLRNGGYSQKLDQFDQVFMEIFSHKWAVRAGDLFLENRTSRFLNFNKKVQGLSTQFNFGLPKNETTIIAAAAIVKGQYAKSNFVGQEGNQGPYKLTGPNGELYILVIAGSENVFVNGILLKQGENADYTIDYNAGEIRFTSRFLITSEMRIVIEYQYTDRNFTRFVSYLSSNQKSKKWAISGNLYTESDLKTQTLQQDLSADQIEILSNAGDNLSLMNATSAVSDSYSTNKILYKKVFKNGKTFFEYSNLSTDQLFKVHFSYVGKNKGNYGLKSNDAIGKIFEYIDPNGSFLQGDFEPIIQLISPTKIEIATILGNYAPSEKSDINFEIGISNNDKNLFSSIDDYDNQGFVGKINFKQRLFSKKWQIDSFGNFQFVQQNFKTIERLFAVEFARDWNLPILTGNQNFWQTGLNFLLPKNAQLQYAFEQLSFSNQFLGKRHSLTGTFDLKKWKIQNNSHLMENQTNNSTSKFYKQNLQIGFHFDKNWISTHFSTENNLEKSNQTKLILPLSQKNLAFGGKIGRGDSSHVFVEIGFAKRLNDSLQNGFLKRVNHSNTYFLKSKIIENLKNDLFLQINYRNLNFETATAKPINSLNTKLQYKGQFLGGLIQNNTLFETNSGSLAQQEFTYLEVQPGLGVYDWHDYNGNGTQELQEFEVAAFADLAKYVRVFLPNQVFVKTNQNKFSETLIINPILWQNSSGFFKVLSKLYNQTFFLMDRKMIRNQDGFDLNPFKDDANLLGLNRVFKNNLYWNRALQKHTICYSFLKNQTRNFLSFGSIESANQSHQIQYTHLIASSWLLDCDAKWGTSSLFSENYPERNFELQNPKIGSKLGYLFSKSSKFESYLEFQTKKNRIGEFESLIQKKLGFAFSMSTEKNWNLNAEITFFDNQFEGNSLSSTGFQILEGLQPGNNTTWKLFLLKKINSFLDLNINYQGRKGEISQTIQSGTIQLKAYF